MLVGATYTGRPPSPASVKRASGVKLRSTKPGWFMLRAQVASAESATRLPSAGPAQLRLERRLRGA
jgi:hypothetical protein